MTTVQIRHFISRPSPAGARHYWQPSAALRAAGFAPQKLPADAIAAAREAQRLNAAVDAWRATPAAPAPKQSAGSLAALVREFKRSADWQGLREKTRAQYAWALAAVLDGLGSSRLVRAITARDVRQLADRLALTPGKRTAAIAALRLLLEYGRRNDWLEINPAIRPGISDDAAKGKLWSPAAIAAFVEEADAQGLHSLGTAVVINSWLGQREADVIAITGASIAGGRLLITQSKTGADVDLPVGLVPQLVARLEQETQRRAARAVASTRLLVNENTSQGWQPWEFRRGVALVRHAAAERCPELTGLWFMHLRHTAVTRLAESGCSLPEIASVTGHALATVNELVDRYLVRTRKLAENAFNRRLQMEAAQ